MEDVLEAPLEDDGVLEPFATAMVEGRSSVEPLRLPLDILRVVV